MAALLKLANETAKKARTAGLGMIGPEVVAKFESCYKSILESALEGYMASGAASWKYPPEGIRLARRMLKHADKHLLFLRDFVVFTNMRVISVNVQGISGKKKDFTSLPYSKVSAYSVETSGVLDLDSELELYFSGVGKVKFEFAGNSNIVQIGQMISSYILR